MPTFFKFLKKYFIPSRGNGYKPYFLQKKTLFLIFCLVFVFEIVFVLSVFDIIPFSRLLASIVPNVLVDSTNKYREENYLGVLTVNPLLEKAAKLKAEDMAQKSYFSHTSPEGVDPWYWFDKVGYDFVYAGENLAVNFFDSDMLSKAWINSPKHRANIVDNRFTEIGIATAKGVYKNKEAIFVVQLFGRQRSQGLAKNTVPGTLKNNTEKLASNEIIKGENTARASDEAGTLILAQKDLPNEKLTQYSSFFSRIFSSPRDVINYLFFSLIAITVFALILKIIIKIQIQFPILILNGFVILGVISVALLFNRWLILILGKII